MMLGPVLNLVNGPVVAEAIKDQTNRIPKILRADKDDAKVIEDLYLAVLCRMPTEAERTAGVKALRDGAADYQAWLGEYQRRKDTLDAYEKKLDAAQAAWEHETREATTWETLQVASVRSAAGTKLTKKPDGSILASGKNPTPETYTISLKTKKTGITAIRLEVLPDPSLPNQGPGRSPSNGNFVLSEFSVLAHKASSKDAAQPVGLRNARATFSQETYPVTAAIDNNPDTGWAIAPQIGRANSAIFETQAPVGFPEGTELTVTMLQKFAGRDHNIGKFRLSVTTAKTPTLTAAPEDIVKILHTDAAQRMPEQKARLQSYHRSLDGMLPQLAAAVAAIGQPMDPRQPGAQDLVWALINSKSFQFNH
jgi:hypothetical protein